MTQTDFEKYKPNATPYMYMHYTISLEVQLQSVSLHVQWFWNHRAFDILSALNDPTLK